MLRRDLLGDQAAQGDADEVHRAAAGGDPVQLVHDRPREVLQARVLGQGCPGAVAGQVEGVRAQAGQPLLERRQDRVPEGAVAAQGVQQHQVRGHVAGATSSRGAPGGGGVRAVFSTMASVV